MSTLNVIGEFLDSWEQDGLRASARELTVALAETAPRGCASALLIANNTEVPELTHSKTRVEVMPLHTSMIPFIWRGGPSARPLDGEFVHSLSPLVPLRRRAEADGSQTSVTVSNTLPWDAPGVLPKGQAKHIRSLVRRAFKHADVVITPTHAVAERLIDLYGSASQVQVLPLAAPAEYLAGPDAAERRTSLGLPDEYVVSNAYPGETGRLEWILRAMETNPLLPPLVLIGMGAEADLSQWSVLGDRVIQIQNEEVAANGAVISGAQALIMPQLIADCLLTLHGALESGVPVVHSQSACVAETVLDGGIHAESEESFVEALDTITSDEATRERLGVLAHDRSRTYSWRTTAWQLWEIHANI